MRYHLIVRWAGSMLAMLATLAIGCVTRGATQVIVDFRAELALADKAAQLRVEVFGPEGESARDETHDVSTDAAGSLARVPLVPRDGDATRTFRIVGSLIDAQGEVLAQAEAIGRPSTCLKHAINACPLAENSFLSRQRTPDLEGKSLSLDPAVATNCANAVPQQFRRGTDMLSETRALGPKKRHST